MEAGMPDSPEPVSGRMCFKDLLDALSDLHDKQVRGLEAELAGARELLAQSRRKSQHAEALLCPSAADGACALPGAVDHADAWSKAHRELTAPGAHRGTGSSPRLSRTGSSPDPEPDPCRPAGPPHGELTEARTCDPAGPPHREPTEAAPPAVPVADGGQSTAAREAPPPRLSKRNFESQPSTLNRSLTNLTDEVRSLICRQESLVDRLVDEDNWLGEHRKNRLVYKVVKSVCFEALSYILISANSLFIGASMEHQLTVAIEGGSGSGVFDYLEIAFLVWFGVELLLKLLAEDVKVFLGPDRWWNLLDLALVGMGVSQLAAESGTPNISLTRNVRLFRVVRVLRVVRVVRICQSLRVMIFAILRSLDALFWVLFVLAFFMYIFALAFMYAATEQFKDNEATWRSMCPDTGSTCSADLECAATCTHLTWLHDNFGSLPRLMLTLFESITGGRDWAEVYDELHQIHTIHGTLFVVFIYFMVFLVLNVVVGTVVDVTSGVSNRDRDRLVTNEISQLQEYTAEVKELFHHADTDKSGQLSLDEFAKYLQDPKVKAYFQTLDLDPREADVLFTLLDRNENGQVGITEFLDGCLRLKGGARNLDMNLVIYQLEHLLKGSQLLLRQVGAAAEAAKEAVVPVRYRSGMPGIAGQPRSSQVGELL